MDLSDSLVALTRSTWAWGSGKARRLAARNLIDGPRACEAVILDVDDTLLDTAAAIRSAARTAALELWPETDLATRERFALLFDSDPHGLFRRYTEGEIPFHEMRRARIASCAQDLGLPWRPRDYRRFCAVYDPAFAALQRVFPDALSAVEVLDRREIPVILLTNSSTPGTRMKLQVLGLAERFPRIVTTDTLGFGKPDPRVFLHACGLVGVAPADAVSVGDSYPNDVLAARAAGLRALWLNRAGGGPVENGPMVRSLDGILHQLARAE
jgi:putative hydrolase of the HAD superfamily